MSWYCRTGFGYDSLFLIDVGFIFKSKVGILGVGIDLGYVF